MSEESQRLIGEECDAIKGILLQKNKEYGDSALNPVRVFSKCDPIEQINVRIDDKLSRISCGELKTIDEDTNLDLIGYLILRRVAIRLAGNTTHTEQKCMDGYDKGTCPFWERCYSPCPFKKVTYG